MSGFPFAPANTQREAIDTAYRLYDFLPLPVETFLHTGFNLAASLKEPEAVAVVAERVERVLDMNRHPHRRVDFFCYYNSGHVARHHPGRTQVQSMKPHQMERDCNLFLPSDAKERGVGATLHWLPPAFVRCGGAPQPGAILCNQADMDRIHVYDIQTMSWRHVRLALNSIPNDFVGEVDWSSGEDCPWWLWLANVGQVRDIVDHGIFHVTARVLYDGSRAIIVTSTAGEFRITTDNRTGKMVVAPPV